MITLTIQAKIYVNQLGEGGHMFYTADKKKYPWLGAWMFKLEEEREALSSSVFIYYPDSDKFEPGKSYTINITLFVNDKILILLKPGSLFKIQAGILYDNKYWATGEILEILDEEETDNKK